MYAASSKKVITVTQKTIDQLHARFWSIHSHIMKHLVHYGILVNSQHGFRAKRATETQLLATVYDIATQYR